MKIKRDTLYNQDLYDLNEEEWDKFNLKNQHSLENIYFKYF